MISVLKSEIRICLIQYLLFLVLSTQDFLLLTYLKNNYKIIDFFLDIFEIISYMILTLRTIPSKTLMVMKDGRKGSVRKDTTSRLERGEW